MPRCHGHFVLNADIPQRRNIKLWSSDPTEPLAEGVVGVHHIPMASGIGNGNRALRPIVIPLRHLNKGEGSEEEPKETSEHNPVTSRYTLLASGRDGSFFVQSGVLNQAQIGADQRLCPTIPLRLLLKTLDGISDLRGIVPTGSGA